MANMTKLTVIFLDRLMDNTPLELFSHFLVTVDTFLIFGHVGRLLLLRGTG